MTNKTISVVVVITYVLVVSDPMIIVVVIFPEPADVATVVGKAVVNTGEVLAVGMVTVVSVYSPGGVVAV